METNISLEAAQELLLGLVKEGKGEKQPLFSCGGRILRQEIKAPGDLPSFSKSPLDGYAFKAEDTKDTSEAKPAFLEVIEEIRAGFAPQKKIKRGQAIKVMTGAPIPAGADAVIRYEDVERTGDTLKIFYPLQSGDNIIKAGEDIKKGEVVAAKGTVLTAPLAGILAAAGMAKAPVFRKIKVALLSTGDELLEPSEKLRPAKIYNSNFYTLSAFCFNLGAKPLSLGIASDEKEIIAAKIKEGLTKADIVIVTGGVSVGDYDLMPLVLDEIGAEKLFWKLDMKPGSPMIAAQKKGKLIIGLSGNPAAAFVTFELIIVPVLKKMLGFANYLPQKVTAVLQNDFCKKSGQRRFLRARLYVKEGKLCASLTGNQGNAILKSMLDCNCFLDVPAGSGALRSGTKLSAVVSGAYSQFLLFEDN